MAKRFTDTGKWKDTWFQDLPTKYKLFWIYLLDECDAAGIWKPNIPLACFQIGEKFDETEIKNVLSNRIEITDKGYWFIKPFIEFQYGELSETCKPHISVIKLLEKHRIKGYGKGIDTLKEKDQEQDNVKDNGELELLRCLEIALKDDRWVRLNKATTKELELFNKKLESEGVYNKTPIDYKTHFSRWKKKEPEELKEVKKTVLVIS